MLGRFSGQSFLRRKQKFVNPCFFMRIKWLCLCAAFCLPSAVSAQAPASAIEWLNEPPHSSTPVVLQEQTAISPREAIEIKPLTPVFREHRSGVLPPDVTGLPLDIWVGAEFAKLKPLFAKAAKQHTPEAQKLLFSLLLADTIEPGEQGAPHDFLKLRADHLKELGAVEQALALIEKDARQFAPEVFALWFELALLADQAARACAVIVQNPLLTPRVEKKIFCYLQTGDAATATVLFDGARALAMLSKRHESMLESFLFPIGDDQEISAPAPESALEFRIFEAIGARPSTARLTRCFAVLDLQNAAGWKAQLRAVESLAQSGAVGANALWGVYASGKPSASGGVWERVSAVQALQRAIETSNIADAQEAVTQVWSHGRDAGLEAAYSELFGADLLGFPLQNEAQDAAFMLQMIAGKLSQVPPPQRTKRFLWNILSGEVDPKLATTPAQNAAASVFANHSIPAANLQNAPLGPHLLTLLEHMSRAQEGDVIAFISALRGLLDVGLEMPARRYAVQHLILFDDQFRLN